MIEDLRAITLFCKTVECGSFRQCATHFNLSPSIVSQQISNLEQKYGITLLYRSTRKLKLTSEGAAFFEKAQTMVASAQDALSVLSEKSDHPSGTLHLTMPAGLIKSPQMAQIAQFSQDHPDIKLDIHFTDKRLDLIQEGIDLAIRAGQLDDSSLKSKKIGELHRTLVCTPQYASRHPLPTHGDDLKNWDWIKMKMMPPYRTLCDEKGISHDIHFTPHVEVDNTDAMCEMTRLGLGLSTPPDFLVERDIKEGALVEILPSWRASSMNVYALWPENSVRRKLTALLLEKAFSA
ncbi:LysR family transcriptional regulator [Terasakiella sp. A23]|uniref:LysR family transcriptional regulator n=1 Tax=Terasakiella sp. FCG-A23 TaxID=3080561 RepID=UPI00295300FF|nr:LysR family transcriptional regulator [Terasakiella sp. A23]MDV7340126.1 LysR family transcriptional regulator [Terasakiella sp. A23]